MTIFVVIHLFMVSKTLTKAEEQLMQYLWALQKGYLKDLVEKFPQPKPAYTTVSTVIRVLVKKEFIGYEAHGKSHQYYPLISKATYFRGQLKPMLANYISGSPSEFASLFANDNLNISQLEEIKDLIEDKIKKLKSKKK
jgi:BlaI family transcriptional regulator, penicillinase repressor